MPLSSLPLNLPGLNSVVIWTDTSHATRLAGRGGQ